MLYFDLRTTEDVLAVARDCGNARPLQRLLALAHWNGAICVAIEQNAHSEVWDDEQDLLYTSLSNHIEGQPLKLHFLRTAVATDDEFRALPPDAAVGYALIRPSPLGTVAEASVMPPFRSEHHYVTCSPSSTTNSPDCWLPFMQQDGIVTRCAHASLWMATSALSRRFPGSTIVTPQHVYNFMRTRWSGSPLIPSGGLHHYDIGAILASHNYRVSKFDFEGIRDARGEVPWADRLVYSYVESGIPVIIGIETQEQRHSLVLLGHGFDSDAWWSGAAPEYYPRLFGGQQWLPSSFWATDYILHDDNFGPYLNISRGSIRTRVYAALVAIPEFLNMMLPPFEAEIKAYAWICAALDDDYPGVASQSAAPIAAEFCLWASQQKLVLRTVLINRDDFVQHLETTSYGADAKQAVSSASLKDWMWMVEISSPTIFGEYHKFGEILLDPTVPPNFQAPAALLLWLHFPGYLFHRSPTGWQHVVVKDDHLAGLYHRPSLAPC
jgi:hypothetical protein